MFQKIGLKAIEAKQMYSDGWFTSMMSSKGGRLAMTSDLLAQQAQFLVPTCSVRTPNRKPTTTPRVEYKNTYLPAGDGSTHEDYRIPHIPLVPRDIIPRAEKRQ
jgi:hypothetical protein